MAEDGERVQKRRRRGEGEVRRLSSDSISRRDYQTGADTSSLLLLPRAIILVSLVAGVVPLRVEGDLSRTQTRADACADSAGHVRAQRAE